MLNSPRLLLWLGGWVVVIALRIILSSPPLYLYYNLNFHPNPIPSPCYLTILYSLVSRNSHDLFSMIGSITRRITWNLVILKFIHRESNQLGSVLNEPCPVVVTTLWRITSPCFSGSCTATRTGSHPSLSCFIFSGTHATLTSRKNANQLQFRANWNFRVFIAHASSTRKSFWKIIWTDVKIETKKNQRSRFRRSSIHVRLVRKYLLTN